jgi:hypothetical protein
MLSHGKAEPDQAGLREPTALAKLPADEQVLCRTRWAEVDAVLKKARQWSAMGDVAGPHARFDAAGHRFRWPPI